MGRLLPGSRAARLTQLWTLARPRGSPSSGRSSIPCPESERKYSNVSRGWQERVRIATEN
jgi:hypothetical protein